MIGQYVRVSGSYTYLDAIVNASLTSGALKPAINPAFPSIPIGAFSPLVGNRPFRRPANSGSMLIAYSQGKAQIALAGYFSGKQDDSTFLNDSSFGNSLLLPNQNLDAAYAKLDLSGSYRIHPRLKWYLSIENLANSKYEAAFGYPALPASVRTGVTVMLGGDR
jgi:vitamin B12 transporter